MLVSTSGCWVLVGLLTRESSHMSAHNRTLDMHTTAVCAWRRTLSTVTNEATCVLCGSNVGGRFAPPFYDV